MTDRSVPATAEDYRALATMRFYPGGYEIYFVTDDGGILCSPCVVDNWDDTIRDADPGDGWKIAGYDHDGNLDDPVSCDHCYRVIGDDGSETETETISTTDGRSE